MIKLIIFIIIIVCDVFSFIDYRTIYVPIDSVNNVSNLESYVFGINFIDTIIEIVNECDSSNMYSISHRSPSLSGIGSYSVDVLYRNGVFSKYGTLKNYSEFEIVTLDNNLLKSISDNDTLCFKLNQIQGISIHPDRKSRFKGLLILGGLFSLSGIIAISAIVLIGNALH